MAQQLQIDAVKHSCISEWQLEQEWKMNAKKLNIAKSKNTKQWSYFSANFPLSAG